MTMAWQLAGSLLAIGLLVLLAWRYGQTGLPALRDEVEARAIADSIAGGFAATSCAIDGNGHGALLRDSNGRIVLVHPHGAQFIARLLGNATVCRREGAMLIVRDGNLSLPLDLAREAKEWEVLLAGPGLAA